MIKLDKKALSWLILSVACLLIPMLFAMATIFPLGSMLFAVEVMAMNGLFALAFILLFKKPKKVAKEPLYMLGFIGMIALPFVFAYLYVSPALAMTYSVMYALMYFVFASGALTLTLQWKKIKNLV